MVNRMADRPEFRCRHKFALHQPAGGFLVKVERLFERRPVLRLELLENTFAAVFFNIFEHSRRVI